MNSSELKVGQLFAVNFPYAPEHESERSHAFPFIQSDRLGFRITNIMVQCDHLDVTIINVKTGREDTFGFGFDEEIVANWRLLEDVP